MGRIEVVGDLGSVLQIRCSEPTEVAAFNLLALVYHIAM
jgi:hypothetical protein